MSVLNFEGLSAARLERDPFDYFVVRDFIKQEHAAAILGGFPRIDQGGSFPLVSLEYGPAFQSLCQELEGPQMRAAISEKLEIDLAGRPTTLTVRGHCRSKDGKIHVDSKTKLVTVLLYLNPAWSDPGGHLRLLRNGHDLEAMVAEIAPELGTLVVFRNGPAAWHGHTSYEGVRRAMQLNWVCDEQAVRRSERRHGLSALWKKIRTRIFSGSSSSAAARSAPGPNHSLDTMRAA
jgi:hypothetical protein